MSLRTPPNRRGGALEDLLLQFGSQQSAGSATKARRETASATPSVAQTPQSKPSTPVVTQRRRKMEVTPLHRVETPPVPSTSTSDIAESSAVTSEDELLSAHKTRARSLHARAFQEAETLKMEKSRRERDESTPRRSGRTNRNDILASDTVYLTPTAKSRRMATPSPRKLDTARLRLHDEISRKTKTKANSFVVANKDYFLPLLPANNYVSRLSANGQPASVVEYQRLTTQPKGVVATLKPYQLDGLSFLVHLHNNGISGILSDEMGLGKTLQTLSLFQYLEEQDKKTGATSEELRPYLVICPLSVLDSWVNEARRWVPELKVLRFHGTGDEKARLKKVAFGQEDQHGNETSQSRRRKASRKAGMKVSKLPEAASDSYKIIVTTYDVYKAEANWFKHSFLWRYVVLDEGHMIKSNVTQISNALKSVASEYRLILTGTPVQNDLVELWSLLSWIMPDIFTSSTQTLFKESFDLSRGRANAKTMDDARRLLELIMLRRMKSSPEVDLGLPPKEEILLYVPLTPMQRFWYMRLLTRVDDNTLNDLFADGKNKERAALEKEKHEEMALDPLQKSQGSHGPVVAVNDQQIWEETTEIMRKAVEKDRSGGTSTAWRKLMNLVMQLRKCCSHPYLLSDALPDPYYIGQHLIHASGKFIMLEKLLKHSIGQGKKTLIFSSFTRTLDVCEDLLGMVGDWGQIFKFLRLDGSTGRARRNLAMRLFNDRASPYKVMLISTKAGGLGINLTAAEDVIFLDEDWNPQITLQAEARAHRIGQTRKVTIYKLCTQGTVEEQMMGRIRKKLYLSTKITESMRNVYGTESASGGPELAGDVPEMSTTQLKTLVRRGAQTLSHPEIDVTELLSWDLNTMMQKCRDKVADPHHSAESNAEVDEEKWLSVMERVECAVFDGKRYQRNTEKRGRKGATDESNILSDRRQRKEMTVMIDGYEVSKASLDCAEWEAVPTLAGKDPRLAEPVRDKRHEYAHQEHCLACFDGPDAGHMVACKSCPRAYHHDCLHEDYQERAKGFSGFFCSQHTCCGCYKNTTDAGGLMYRCRWCPRGYCEDCLDWTKAEMVGDDLPEFEMLGERAGMTGFYVKCPDCVEAIESDEERKVWVEGMQNTYAEQYEEFLKSQVEEQKRLEKQQDNMQERLRNEGEGGLHSKQTVVLLRGRDHLEDEDHESLGPSLTDNSTYYDSAVSTPREMPLPQSARKRAKQTSSKTETSPEKRAKLDHWDADDDVFSVNALNEEI